MNSQLFLACRSKAALRAVLLALGLAGCGGGVDSGGTGGASTYASGPINGYGSIVVNGVHFEDRTASSISDDDGIARTRSDLKLGMVVETRGAAISVDPSGDSNSNAISIVIGSEIVGPIDTITANSLTVLGRSIDVQPTTVFDPTSPFSALVQGDVIEVYGLYNAFTDRLTATRIERKPNAANFKIQGPINIQTASSFKIGTLLVDYSAVPVGQRPTNMIDGMILRVRLNTVPVGAAWFANRLRGGTNTPNDGHETKVEGVIDSFVSRTQFSVAGVPVSATLQSIDETNGVALALGVRVQVEGTFTNGTLVAQKVEVEVEGGDDFDFRGKLQAVDNLAQTLMIQGVTIDISDPNIDFNNGTADQLVPNANVRVRASLVNGTQLKAYGVQFRN